MEEVVLKEAKAWYFKSAVNMLEGYLILTNKRLVYSGIQARVQYNHGALGNVIKDQMGKAMGYDHQDEQLIFDIPLAEVSHGIKRYGLSKRLVICDAQQIEYKLTVDGGKSGRDEWPAAIDEAKRAG